MQLALLHPVFKWANVALQGNAKWLRIEEKLGAKPTDEVSRRVHPHLMQIATAARDASFKDTLHAAVSFIKSFLSYRTPPHPPQAVPLPLKGEGILSGNLSQNQFFSRQHKVNREAPQKFQRDRNEKHRRRTQPKPPQSTKTTSQRRILLFFQHPIRHLPNQRLRQLIPKLNLFRQGILCNMLFAIIHNLSLCFLSGRNTGL